MSPALKDFAKDVKKDLQKELIKAYPEHQEPARLEATFSAMRYMMFLGDGGKRLRPVLAAMAAQACGGDPKQALPFAQAIEEIHTYTLIIDDMQDSAPIRRGGPTAHKKFDVDTAILAAARLYQRGLLQVHGLPPKDRKTAGDLLDLLHRGQAADLAAQKWRRPLKNLKNLEFIHAGKTSALMQLALLGGAVAAAASDRQKAALFKYGYYLGLAFQVRDELLSALLTTEQLGKPGGSRADRNRLTYPRLKGRMQAQSAAELFSKAAIECLDRKKSGLRDASLLIELAEYAVQRDH